MELMKVLPGVYYKPSLCSCIVQTLSSEEKPPASNTSQVLQLQLTLFLQGYFYIKKKAQLIYKVFSLF